MILTKMEISNRKMALALGVGQYFTGKPCLHGHVAARYTVSGTCVECLRGANAGRPMGSELRARATPGLDVNPAGAAAAHQASEEAAPVRLRVFPMDKPRLVEHVKLFTRLRYPELPDVAAPPLREVKQEAGTILYVVRLHPQDGEAMMHLTNVWMRDRTRGTGEALRLQRLGPVLAAADVADSQDWPDYDPR